MATVAGSEGSGLGPVRTVARPRLCERIVQRLPQVLDVNRLRWDPEGELG